MARTIEYTEEVVIKELKGMLTDINNDENILYLWELFAKRKYSMQRFSERVSTYPEWEVKRLSETIKEILLSRVVKWAITNKLNSTFTIFHLKNNYNWKDKSEVDNSTVIVDATGWLSEEQKKLIVSRYK